MLSVLSPAKSLDFQSQSASQIYTQPIFQQEALELVEQLRILAPQDLCQLMKISDKLGSLNAARFQEWQLPFTLENAKPAALAFTGDVYMGLEASSLDDSSLAFGQQHLAILSGLYGLLKPMDLIQAYRLEMGTKFPNKRSKDIHSFWRPLITKKLKEHLTEQTTPVLVNLASKEYFQAVDTKQLNKRIITPVFKDWKTDQYKIINFYAKKARGLMARFILQEKIDQPDNLKDFAIEGYCFNPLMSEGDSWVFTRRLA